MLGQVFTYSPEDVTMIINDHPIEGFTDGSFISVRRNSPSMKQVRAIRGRSSRVAQRDKSGRILFQLLQTSPDNDILSQIVEFDEINQTGRLNVIIRDTGGTTAIQFLDCYLRGIPDFDFSGTDLSPREWQIDFSYVAKYHLGGNRNNQLDFI